MTILAEKVKDFDLKLLETDQGPLSCECGADMVFERQDVVYETPEGEIRITNTPCYRCPRCGETIWNGLVEVRAQELAWEAKQQNQQQVVFHI